VSVTTTEGLDQLDRNVPAALRSVRQWLVWRFEPQPGKKPRKVPYYVDGHRRVGDQGSDADRKRLATFELALAAFERDDYSGIGFAFLPGDGLIGIDIDGAIDPDSGEISERAHNIIAACNSWTELSPSGKGVHIYLRGETESAKSNDIGVEMFCGRQFFTVTGRTVAGSPDDVADADPAVIARLHATIAQAKAQRRSGSGSARQPVQGVGASPGVDRARIESALSMVDPDLGYNDWIAVGMALFDVLGDNGGLSVWEWWSSRGAKFCGGDAMRTHWRSFGNGRTPGGDAVIFRLATNAGWRPPRRSRPAPMQNDTPHGANDPPPVEEPPPIEDVPPESGRSEFAADIESSNEWMSDLRRSDKGNITATLHNTILILQNDPAWRSVIAFDQFAYRIVKREAPPVLTPKKGEWSDLDDVQALAWISGVYSVEPKKTVVMDAVMHLAHAAGFHPVREYLETREWDGTPRVQTMMATYYGAGSPAAVATLEPDERLRLGVYLKLVGVKWLVGAVARVMDPGCKLDTMIVLEGGQGALKSSSIRALFGREWTADSKLTLGDKDALAQMQGKWCYEMAEMDAFSKADNTTFKQFLTSQDDRVRWHYGRRAEDVPRQCIFVGTTNQHQYGKDPTGMRRIWPVEVGRIDLERLRQDRDQLLAEALVLYRRGVRWWVDNDIVTLDPARTPRLRELGFVAPWTERQLFDEQGDNRQLIDDWQYPIVAWLETHNQIQHVTGATLLGEALKIDTARWTKQEQMRVAEIIKRLGWMPCKVGPRNAQYRAWRRPIDCAEPASASDCAEEHDELPL
jgi:predicted P-loop ATPase